MNAMFFVLNLRNLLQTSSAFAFSNKIHLRNKNNLRYSNHVSNSYRVSIVKSEPSISICF